MRCRPRNAPRPFCPAEVRPLLLDEMIGPKVAAALRERSWDVYGVVERADLRSLPDDSVLDLAARAERILVTRNLVDFLKLDHEWKAGGREHAGLVLIPEASFPQDRSLVGAVVTSLLAAADSGLLPVADQVLFLPRSRS